MKSSSNGFTAAVTDRNNSCSAGTTSSTCPVIPPPRATNDISKPTVLVVANHRQQQQQQKQPQEQKQQPTLEQQKGISSVPVPAVKTITTTKTTTTTRRTTTTTTMITTTRTAAPHDSLSSSTIATTSTPAISTVTPVPLKSCMATRPEPAASRSSSCSRPSLLPSGGSNDNATQSNKGRTQVVRHTSSSNSSTMVSFGHVHIREHARTVGDNPSVSSGPALDLSWEYNERVHPLDEYEYHRTMIEPRRPKSCLILKRGEREKMLKCDHQVSRSDIAAAVRSINRIKANRRQTLNNMKFSTVEEMWEKVRRNGRRIFGLKKSTGKEIEDLWKNAERNMEKLKKSRHGRSSFSGSSDSSRSATPTRGGSLRVSAGKRDPSMVSSSTSTSTFWKKKVGNNSGKSSKGSSNNSFQTHRSLDESSHYMRRDIDLHLSRHVKKYDLYGDHLDASRDKLKRMESDEITPTASNHGWSEEKMDQIDSHEDAVVIEKQCESPGVLLEPGKRPIVSFVGCDGGHPTLKMTRQTQPLASKREEGRRKYSHDQDSDSDGLTLTTASMDLSASIVPEEMAPIAKITSTISVLHRKHSNPIIAVEEED